MQILLFLPLLFSFLMVFLTVEAWIKKAKNVGVKGKDIHKIDQREVAESGGIPVMAGFLIAVLSYIAIKTFYFKDNSYLIEILSIVTTLIMVMSIGFLDDLFGWKIGLNKRTRLLLVAISSIPIIVINAGTSKITLPFLGIVELGFIYPLVLIPIGILGATVTYNFLAGYNGLEAGQGIIILTFLSFISYATGSTWLALIGLIMVASLIAFYFFNSFPSKIFPGDSLTYPIGALIAIMAIFGNFERIALFVFIPYIIETILKIRGKLKKESFAKLKRDGSIEEPYNKIYGLEHLAIRVIKKIKGRVYEKEVVYLIFLFQIVVCLLAMIIFGSYLF